MQLYRTPELVRLLFPKLKGKWGEVNLAQAVSWFGDLCNDSNFPSNPFLDPNYCEKWKVFIHKIMGIDFSWGGYLEDRSILWKGSYLPEDGAIHLGIDFYVPAGTEVCLPTPSRLIHCIKDEDQQGGWGGKLIFQNLHGYYILGHLDADNMLVKPEPENIGGVMVEKTFKVGDCVGTVASSDKNGGWSPHLHIQCLKTLDPNVDGYGKMYDGIKDDFPDPVDYLW